MLHTRHVHEFKYNNMVYPAGDGPQPPWTSLPAAEVVRRLIALGLYLNAPERAVICTRCQYALQPAGEAVSKHLWEKHTVPTEARDGLNAFIRSLDLPNPNSLDQRGDGCTPTL